MRQRVAGRDHPPEPKLAFHRHIRRYAAGWHGGLASVRVLSCAEDGGGTPTKSSPSVFLSAISSSPLSRLHCRSTLDRDQHRAATRDSKAKEKGAIGPRSRPSVCPANGGLGGMVEGRTQNQCSKPDRGPPNFRPHRRRSMSARDNSNNDQSRTSLRSILSVSWASASTPDERPLEPHSSQAQDAAFRCVSVQRGCAQRRN